MPVLTPPLPNPNLPQNHPNLDLEPLQHLRMHLPEDPNLVPISKNRSGPPLHEQRIVNLFHTEPGVEAVLDEGLGDAFGVGEAGVGGGFDDRVMDLNGATDTEVAVLTKRLTVDAEDPSDTIESGTGDGGPDDCAGTISFSFVDNVRTQWIRTALYHANHPNEIIKTTTALP